MKKIMMDILACHIDKGFPLEIFECEIQNDEVKEGILYCTKCSRFYPIVDEIPIMLPDELRDKDQDIDFLKNNKQKLPSKIIYESAPWHL